MDLFPYFGEGGPFGEACDKVRFRQLPLHVLAHSETLDNSRIAYRLGYAFAQVLKRRQMSISDESLEQIARNKIIFGNAAQFVFGFRLGEKEKLYET